MPVFDVLASGFCWIFSAEQFNARLDFRREFAMKKIFILGLGAQKSGTTWIADQLQNCKSFKKGLRKEYHVLDKLNQVKFPLSSGFRNEENQLSAMRMSIDIYADHFDSLFSRNSASSHVADITPTYCLCSKATLEEAKIQLEARGFLLKVFFNMREPAERLWSQVKMKNVIHNLGLSKEEEIDFYLEYVKSRDAARRADYVSIINKINSVFDPQEVWIDFYENMFSSQECVGKFADFIELAEFKSSSLTVKSWTTNANSGYEAKLFSAIQEVRGHYRDVIAGIQEMYPDSIPGNWLK